MSPFEQRAELFKDRAKVQESSDLAARAFADAKAKLADLDRESAAIHQARARGRIDDEVVTKFEVERAYAKREIGLAEQALQGARDAQLAVASELAELYALHLDEFAAEAEEATQAAAVALDALRGPWAHAWAAWSIAQARWRPLMPAVREQIEQDFTDRGVFPDPRQFAHLANVPPSPLPPENEVFRADVAARPRGLTPDPSLHAPEEPPAVDVSLPA